MRIGVRAWYTAAACGWLGACLGVLAPQEARAQAPSGPNAAMDGGGGNLTIAADQAMEGEYFNIDTFTISTGVTVTVTGDAPSTGNRLVIRARVIVIDGAVRGDGAGGAGGIGGPPTVPSTNGSGAGGGTGAAANSRDGGGGGGHGGAGGHGAGATGPGGPAHDNPAPPVFAAAANTPAAPPPDQDLNPGSGGGGGGGDLPGATGGDGGAGGASLLLIAQESLFVNGTLSMNGAGGNAGIAPADGTGAGGGGGGSGGGILLCAPDLRFGAAAIVRADGGAGAGGVSGAGPSIDPSGGGAGGGGGRIKILRDTVTGILPPVPSGGAGGAPGPDPGGPPGASGGAGTLLDRAVNFHPAQPVNLGPAPGALMATSTPTLSSSAFADPNGAAGPPAFDLHTASQWRVRAAGSPADWSVTVFDSGVTGGDLTRVTIPALPDGTYFWQVRYRDGGSAAAGVDLFSREYPSGRAEAIRDYSAETDFTIDTTAGAAPVPQSPVGGVNVGAVEFVDFVWSAAADPNGILNYDLQVSASALFDTVLFQLTVEEPHVRAAVRSFGTGNLFWRIRARDTLGNATAFSAAQAFTVAPISRRKKRGRACFVGALTTPPAGEHPTSAPRPRR